MVAAPVMEVLLANRVLAFSAAAAVAASSGAALAQQENAGDGLYVRVGAGASFASDLDQDIDRVFRDFSSCAAIGCNPDRQTLSLDTGFVVSAAAGFNYTQGIRTELEYRYEKPGISSRQFFEAGFDVTDSRLTGFPELSNDDINVHFVFSNFYFDFNNDTRFTPFIGGGVGGAFARNENDDRDAALAYQGRAGISYDLGGGAALDAEYIYLRTNDLVFGSVDEEFVVEGASARIDGDNYVSSSVMLSVRVQF